MRYHILIVERNISSKLSRNPEELASENQEKYEELLGSVIYFDTFKMT